MTEQWVAKQDPDDPVDGAWEVGFTNPRGLYVLLGYCLTEETARLIAAAPALMAGLIAIRDGTVEGTVGGEDVVWFDQITTLYDFCDQIIAKATEPRP